MRRATNRMLAVAIMTLAVSASSTSATPVITIYTGEADALALLPPGTTPDQFAIGVEDFQEGDSFNITYAATNGTINSGYWDTVGPVSFTLGSGSASVFVLEFRPLAGGLAAPEVTMTPVNGAPITIGALTGGDFQPGLLFFAFKSSEPFTAVSLGLASGATFSTDIVGFYDIPEAVPDPASTLLLLGTGLIAAAAFRRKLAR